MARRSISIMHNRLWRDCRISIVIECPVYELRCIEDYFGHIKQFGRSFEGYTKQDRRVIAVPFRSSRSDDTKLSVTPGSTVKPLIDTPAVTIQFDHRRYRPKQTGQAATGGTKADNFT